MCYLTAAFVWAHAAEVVPEAETNLWQQDTRLATAFILHPILVAKSICYVLFHIFY